MGILLKNYKFRPKLTFPHTYKKEEAQLAPLISDIFS